MISEEFSSSAFLLFMFKLMFAHEGWKITNSFYNITKLPPVLCNLQRDVGENCV